MQFVLHNNFLWEFFIAEYLAVFFLVSMSFVSTYVANKKPRIKYIYALIYSLAIFGSALVSFAVLRLLVFLFESNNLYQKVNTDLPPVVNPLGTIFYLLQWGFSNTEVTNSFYVGNLFLVLFAHLLGAFSAVVLFIFINKKWPHFNNYYVNCKTTTLKNISINNIGIIILVSLLFITQFVIYNDNLTQNFIFISASGALITLTLLLTTRWLGDMNFPTNIFVTFGSYLTVLYHNRKSWKNNTVLLGYTVFTYVITALVAVGIYSSVIVN
ncbi:hypothetical protein H9M94_01260 [Mycoplasma sp. Pen4]|uniref:hypothetical protein n=1 Tax=Mycoplasma sp. Pen4 TaxID=640330 RepID=UPI0016544439|nr:hypothetical protein [Mycoplasma sp. Pen4]QNM93886.1 hypothetical protein H9M94_01260 [Mycoplasma sp. Pen4]